ncbi:MAG: zinc ribbon domain-containing protein [Planctomycetota bacterium]|nr:zinc ribbon domain-containing protein [Planctomycetota bacterium]MEE2972077.1 zinc ribbon domain-containing protein [Planctomycetota bacterium]
MKIEPDIEPSADDSTPRDRDEAVKMDARVRWAPDPSWAATAMSKRRFGGIPGLVVRIVLVMFFIGMSALPIVALFVDDGVERPWEALLIVGFLLLFAGLVSWELGQQIRAIRLSVRIRDAGRERGMRTVCPRCAGDPFIAGHPCCRRFPRGWTSEALSDFWHAIAMARRQAGAAIKREYLHRRGPFRTSIAFPGGGWIGRLATWTRLGGAMFWPLFAATILGFGGTLVAFVAMMLGTPIGGPWIWWIGPGALLIGAVLAGRVFLRYRRETSQADELTGPRCRACGYELHPPWSLVCPECGSRLDAWNTVSFAPDFDGEGVGKAL